MQYSTQWLLFQKSEEMYFSHRHAFMQDKTTMVNDLSIALSRAGDNITALRFLSEAQAESDIIFFLLPKILDAAVDSANLETLKMSKQVLYLYKEDTSIRNEIHALTSSYLGDNDDWHYRRIAELYDFLEYKNELLNFIKICRVNTNPEIQEVGNDFHFKQDSKYNKY